MNVVLNADEFGEDGPKRGAEGTAWGYGWDDAEDFFMHVTFFHFPGYFVVYPHMLDFDSSSVLKS